MLSIIDLSYPDSVLPSDPAKLEPGNTRLDTPLVQPNARSKPLQKTPKRHVSPDSVAAVDKENTPKRRRSANIFALCDAGYSKDLRTGIVERLKQRFEEREASLAKYTRKMSSIVCTESNMRSRNFAGFLEYDVGVYWKVKNDKFIVWDFGPGAAAKRSGVRPGDILRKVDGIEILNFTADENGHHPIDDLILGRRGSDCILTFLRVIETVPERVKASCGNTRLGEYSVTLKRTSFAHTLDLNAGGEDKVLHRPSADDLEQV